MSRARLNNTAPSDVMVTTSTLPRELSETPRSDILEFEPGCVVLFSGVTSLEYRIQETLRNCWTRCAIIVPGPDGNPVLLQSTSRPIAADLRTGQLLTGVQMVAVRDVLTRFDGQIGFRQVAPALSSAQNNALAEFALTNIGLPFNYSPYYALRAARRRNRDGDGTRYYCTELVAATLQHVGVLAEPPSGRSASNHVPGDFSAATEDLSLKDGYKLLPQETVHCPCST